MEAFNVVSVRRKDDFSIVLNIKDPVSGDLEEKFFASLRMGIHWPTVISPAYYVILGQEISSSNRSGRRQVIGEYVSEQIGVNKFYGKIIQIADKFHCHTIYALLPENRYEYGYLQDLEKFAWDMDCSLSIENAENGDDFFLAIARVKDSIDNCTLLIPAHTVVFDQLQGITREDLLQDRLQERFFCIDALGHVLDGFYRHPPAIHITNNNRPNAPY